MWESMLEKTQYLLGQKPTQADAEAARELKGLKPRPASHPNLFAWAAIVTKFSEAVTKTWAAGDLPRPASCEKKEEVKKSEDDIDEDDLFSGEPVAAPVKKPVVVKKKPAVVAKSIVLIEVKPWDEDTNLDELAKRILAVELDGLVWKTEYKKEPIAFGIFKLVVGMVIEDEKVSVDEDIVNMLQEWDDSVQSVDIVSFNKL